MEAGSVDNSAGSSFYRYAVCAWCYQYRRQQLVHQRFHESVYSDPSVHSSTEEAHSHTPAPAVPHLRDVFQCTGCLHYTVQCRICEYGHARRGTAPLGRKTNKVSNRIVSRRG